LKNEMRFSPLRTGILISAALSAALSLCAQGQQTAEKEGPLSEFRGMPPRATSGDYQGHAQAGTVAIGAEFMEHAIPTPEQTLSTDDYVVVEVGLFGPPGARTTLSRDNFSLRVNGKKTPLPCEPYELVFESLKDPEWAPPAPPESKSKGGISAGGGGQGDNSPPPPVHMPFELRRAMQQHVQRAAMLEGDRALPQAGLLFFHYRGKRDGMRSVELIYTGPAGAATVPLQP
jgi:hypothetical protein